MKGEGDDQPDTNHRLGQQPQLLLTAALGAAAVVKVLQHLPYRGRQRFAVAKQAILFDQQAGQQPTHHHRHGDGRHADKELAKMPARRFGDNQILRFANHGHDSAEGGPDAGVHHQAAQKAAELLQHLAVVLLDMAVVQQIIIIRAS